MLLHFFLVLFINFIAFVNLKEDEKAQSAIRFVLKRTKVLNVLNEINK